MSANLRLVTNTNHALANEPVEPVETDDGYDDWLKYEDWDFDRCPGGDDCPAPDECSDCNPAVNAFMTGGYIAAVAESARDYVADGEYTRADNAIAMLDDLATYCDRMPTKKALHDVIDGLIHMLKIQHRMNTREHRADTHPPAPDETPEPSPHASEWTNGTWNPGPLATGH